MRRLAIVAMAIKLNGGFAGNPQLDGAAATLRLEMGQDGLHDSIW
jgi:hypothetical protein